MGGSINKVILIGRLGKAPEIRHSHDGAKIAHVTLATSEQWKDKATGERKERTEWHRVVIFNERLADFIERFGKKGSQIYLEGQLQTRKWTDNNGQDKYLTEVVVNRFRGEISLLDSKGSEPNEVDASTSPMGTFDPGKIPDSFDDDIPF